MWKDKLKTHGSLRALAIAFACAGFLSGCIGQTLTDAATGSSGTTPTRTLAFVDAPTYDLGTVPSGTSKLVRLSISSTGTGDATITSNTNSNSNFTFNGGNFPGTGGTCTQPIQGNCSIAILFTAPANGTYSDVVTIAYNTGDGASSISITLSATAITAASVAIDGGVTYAYGNKTVGTSNDATLTVSNLGGLIASAMSFSGLSAPITYKGGTYPGTGGTCATTLDTFTTCTIVVTYAPTSAVSTNVLFSLSYYNGSSTVSTSVSITGTGQIPASLSITNPIADPYNYGTVTIGAAGVDKTFTLSNSGGLTATSLTSTGPSAPFSFKGGTYPGTGGTCSTSLANGATCTVVVTYLPTTPGVDSSSLALSYNDGTGSTINLSHGVTGTGGNAADLQISDGTSYDFGSHTVGTTTNHTFTITNAGGSTATTIAGAALVAPYAYLGGTYPGTGGSCSTSLGAGATCTIFVSFAPSATGAFTDTLTLNYNNGVSAGMTSTRSLTGTGGSVANLSISDGATYNYGSVVKGYTLTKTFTVSNIGGITATAISGAALSAPFSYFGGTYPGTGGTCGASLGAAGTCTVLVQFAPTATGTSNATLTLNYNNSSTATTSTRAITGTGATITKIAGGTGHTCALYSTGIVKCWGAGSFGQLGNGASSSSTTPVSVNGIVSATDIAVGANHSCAIVSGGRVYCWGADNAGQLGDNASLTSSNTPSPVALYTDFTLISAGGDTTCGLRSGGTIVCWGNDAEGSVGDDAAFVDQPTPVTVSGLTGMTDVSVGRGHACARKSNNSFRCWGSDSYGQLGNGGATSNSGTPVTPSSGTSLSSATGGDVSCALNSGGSVKCWGADDMGELGDNAALSSKNTPTTISGLANVTSITIGLKHGCALTSTSSIVCWGSDVSGQIGDNASYTNQSTPAAVTGMASVANIGVGENHSCGVLSSGLVYCWGQGTANQLGDGGSTNQPTPVLVQGL